MPSSPIPLHNPAGLLRRINKLIEQRRFSKALPLARQLREADPANPLVWAAEGICLSESGQSADALRIFDRALKSFPNDYNILYYKAETLSSQKKFEKAETAYRAALANVPASDRRSRSECLNGLGVALWHLLMKDEALECWRLAIQADPKNKTARRNLEEFTSPYGRPQSVSPAMDDVNKFREVQTSRYLASQGRDEFESQREVAKVLGAIFEAWNNRLAPRGAELDRMTAAEKTVLFKSTHVDFEGGRPRASTGRRKPEPPPPNEQEMSDAVKEVERKAWKQLGFLPSSQAALLVVVIGKPLLEAVGLRYSRIKRIIDGQQLKKGDQETITWTWEVVREVMRAAGAGDATRRMTSLSAAQGIAEQRLNRKKSLNVVRAVLELAEEVLDESDPDEEDER